MKKAKHELILSMNPKVGRNINRSIVLNTIREKQPISRATISVITGLNKSTVSSIVSSLISDDLVGEDLDRNQMVGRNPLNLSIKKAKNYVGAIYFDSVNTHLAIIDIDGTIKNSLEIKTEINNPVEFIERCVEKLNVMRSQLSPHNLRGIGVAIAGIVDSSKSQLIYASNLGWRDLDLGTIIRNQAPNVEIITVENDAKASALAELFLGKHGVNPANFVFLSIGPGIGSGIVINNHILSGRFHAAGECGHMTIVEGGEPCSCGNQGCWEVYASDRATLRRYAASIDLPPTRSSNLVIESVINLAKQGDPLAKEALSKTATYLGLGIANIIRIFDPESIIVGGSITQAWDIVYPVIIEIVSKRGFWEKQSETKILPTSLIGNPPLLGAAALSIRKVFTDYRIAL